MTYFAVQGSTVAASFCGLSDISGNFIGGGAVWVQPTSSAGATTFAGTVIASGGTSVGEVAIADGFVDWWDTVSPGNTVIKQAPVGGGAAKVAPWP